MRKIERDTPLGWTKFLQSRGERRDRAEDIEDAVDLIAKLLVYDPRGRLTAREALHHRFIAQTDKKRLRDRF